MKEKLFKILTPHEWDISKVSGFITTELDLNDGFIHLSNAAQLPTTLALYFSEHEEVILLLPELKQVQDKLIYEPVDSQSKRSGKFGHLYAELKVSQISKSWILKRNAFEIPEDILLEAEMEKAAD
ncbi:DUF952 domain-containing protein [Gammaproteobacteria bacterium]|nr:DUF952 domain-containing protein [Gammaproteobacteria bacterium]MDC1099781.1 DUF952 domain-containing protein [Gammaproteobacteria bacterium]